MFMDFYRLNEQPFGVTPDPRFLYFSAGHREALAALYYAIEERRGFSALVAPPGMGKTSLLFRLLESLQESAKTAFLFQAGDDSKDFLESLVRDLGVSASSDNLPALHDALNEMLVREMDANRRVVVVIDEAQNLSEEMLEEARLLSNFETPAAKMMHIVLAGQPGLEERLASPALTQLRQRVGAIAHLAPLDLGETIDYVERRLRAAGHDGPRLFTPGAFESIAALSEGIPRNINSICFQAMSLGCVYRKQLIDADIIAEVERDLEVKKEKEKVPAKPVLPEPRVQKTQHSVLRLPAEAPTWPSLPAAAQAVDFGYYGMPHAGALGTGQSSARAGMGLIAFLVVFLPVLTFAVLNRAGIVNGARLLERVTGISDSDSNAARVISQSPRPPEAPTVQKIEGAEVRDSKTPDASRAEPTTETENRSNIEAGKGAAESRVIRITRKETVKDLAAEYFGTSNSSAVALILFENPTIRHPYQVLPAGTQVVLPPGAKGNEGDAAKSFEGLKPAEKRASSEAPRSVRRSGRVRVNRDETLFQFAMEQMGKGDWSTVRRIRAVNPQIRDPYQILQRGQWITLPEEIAQR
jgi:general secretion pathway protein A